MVHVQNIYHLYNTHCNQLSCHFYEIVNKEIQNIATTRESRQTQCQEKILKTDARKNEAFVALFSHIAFRNLLYQYDVDLHGQCDYDCVSTQLPSQEHKPIRTTRLGMYVSGPVPPSPTNHRAPPHTPMKNVLICILSFPFPLL